MLPEEEVFMGRLIIDDTTIYEIDEECMRQKEQKEIKFKTAGGKIPKAQSSESARAKERPAP